MRHALKHCLAVIDEVAATAQVEVEYVDGVHLLDLIVIIAYLQLFDDCLRGTEEYALHEVALSRQLHLDEYYFTALCEGFHVHTICLVFLGVAVAFTFQDVRDSYFLAQKH